MKRHLLLTFAILTTAIGMAQSSPWSLTLKTTDGLPGVIDEDYGQYTFTTPTLKFDQPVSKVRLTVVSTNTFDAQESGHLGTTGMNGPAFPYIAISELEVIKPNNKRTSYDATSNAASINSGGSIEYICDGTYDTQFTTTSYMGDCPQAYHYVELDLYEPLTEFTIRWHSRLNHENMPTHVGITLGTEYLPYPEQGFTLGEKVTNVEDLKNGGFFIIEGHAPEYLHSFTGTKRTYPGGGFWHSPFGGHVTPNAASAVYFIPVKGKENTYKVAWLNSDRFIVDQAANYQIDWTKYENKAAAVKFTPCDTVDGDFIMTMRDSLIIGHNALGKMLLAEHKADKMTSSTPVVWNFSVYKANMNPAATNFLLKNAMDKAEELIELYGYNEDFDNGEYEELTALLNKGKSILTNPEATNAEIVNTRIELIDAMKNYASLGVYFYSDSIQLIMEAFENGVYQTSEAPNWTLGTYPKNKLNNLQFTSDKILDKAEEATTLIEIEEITAEIKKLITTFWSYQITEYTTFPMRYNGEEDGLPGEVVKNQGCIWESRTYFFDKEVTGFRLTVFQTNSENKYGNYDYFSLFELQVYDADNKLIKLTSDNITSNSVNNKIYGGIEALCDNNFQTYFQTASQDDQDLNGYDGMSEYPYIEVTFPKPVTSFTYRQYGRSFSDGRYQDVPVKFAIGAKGVKVTPDGTSISSVEVDGDEVISVTYYNTVGVSSETPFNGLNIVKTVYANGTVKTNKKIIK